jgi:hypothetical protein
MPPRIKPKYMMTPGTYRIPAPSWKTTPQGKMTPTSRKKTPPPVKKAGQTMDDMLEAVRLVRRDKLSIQKAAKHINEQKATLFPVMVAK